MVKEDYVSFEIAKLLKEKGFDTLCTVWYAEYTSQYNNDTYNVIQYDDHNRFEKGYKFLFYVPTLQMAMKWLREVHNINISVGPHSYREGKPFDYEFVYWNGVKYHTPYDEKHPTYHELFGKTWKKHEEAVEAAIKYCLENLI